MYVQYIATCYFDFKGTSLNSLVKADLNLPLSQFSLKEALARVMAMVYFVGSLKPLGF